MSALATATVAMLARAAGAHRRLDERVYAFVLRHRTPTLTTIFRDVTRLGDTTTIVSIVAVASTLLIARRRWTSLAVLLGSATGAGLLSSILKLTVHRSRPTPSTMLVNAPGYAFPSGHATQSIATYAALALVLSVTLRRPVQRVALGGAAVLVAVGIGLSRLYLGVHWATDVLGGWMLAAAWLLALATLTSGRTRRPDAPAGAQRNPTRAKPGEADRRPRGADDA